MEMKFWFDNWMVVEKIGVAGKSGHHSHAGRPGRRGGSAPAKSLSGDEKMAWMTALNMDFYNQTKDLPHGRRLQDAIQDVPWETGASLGSFRSKFESPEEEKDLPRPKMGGTTPERVQWALAQEKRPTQLVEIRTIRQRTGLTEKQIDYEAYSQLRPFMQWEHKADLNQLRIKNGWVVSPGKGVVSDATTRRIALKAMGKTVTQLWKEMVAKRPK